MSDELKVFISCVSSQFKACREALSSDLRAIGCEVKVQEDFQLGPDTLIAQIEAYVAQCDRVIVLIGDTYGCEAAKESVSSTVQPRSYTQWEYYFALGERLNSKPAQPIDRYVYFASRDFLDEHRVEQPAGHAEYQLKFKQIIEASGKHRGEFGSVDQLCRLVLRDGWQINERPAKPCNLPYDSLGSLFKGRNRFIESLHAHLQQNRGQATAIVAKQAIHGLGVVGKTRLAVEYAWRFAADYCALLFVPADSGEALNRNLAALCGPKLLNLPEQEATEEDIRTAAALRWFAKHSGWLLILDNVDTSVAADAVEDLFGQLQAGHVLVTSRLSDWSGGVDTMALDVLDEADAMTFILEQTQQRRTAQEKDAADALALARELDGLALALEQASAFIE